MSNLPNGKPKLTKEEAGKIVTAVLGSDVPDLVLIGIRGYYSKMGANPTDNDINLYDDAIIVYGKDTYKTFNGNTDPSFVKKRGRSLAMLNTGVYTFYKGRHKGQYNALRAYPEGVVLNCTREGKPATCSFINIHKGGLNAGGAGVTWSEGCQTVPSTQYNAFIEEVYAQMLQHKMKTVKYILLSNRKMLEILS